MWFAASAGLLSVAANDEKIEKEVNIFLSKFSGNASITKEGRFAMAVRPYAFAKANYWTLAFRTTKIYSILRKALLFKNGISTSLLFLARNLNQEQEEEMKKKWKLDTFISFSCISNLA